MSETIYRMCIPCTGQGRTRERQRQRVYNYHTRNYDYQYQYVNKTCSSCYGRGQVVDTIATRRKQQQVRKQQQKIRLQKIQKEKQRIQNQKKQAQYKQYKIKQNLWQKYANQYNQQIEKQNQNHKISQNQTNQTKFIPPNSSQNDLNQPLLGQYQTKNKQNYGKCFDQNNMDYKKDTKSQESSVDCGTCDGKGYFGFSRQKDTICKKCNGKGKKTVNNDIPTYKNSDSTNYFESYQQKNNYSPSPSYQNYQQPSSYQVKKKTEDQLRRSFQKMYKKQKQRQEKQEQEKRRREQKRYRQFSAQYERERQQRLQKYRKQQQEFNKTEEGQQLLRKKQAEQRARQRKQSCKNLLKIIFCCCGEPTDNKWICWFLSIGIIVIYIIFFVVLPQYLTQN